LIEDIVSQSILFVKLFGIFCWKSG